MKIDTRHVFVDLENENAPLITNMPVPGEFVRNEDGEFKRTEQGARIPMVREVEMSFRFCVAQAGHKYTQVEGCSPEEKIKVGRLVQRMYRRPVCDFSSDEAVLIKKMVKAMYGWAIVIQVEDLIDPPPAEEAQIEAAEESNSEKELQKL